ncbi:MAG: lipid II flippase MurJ [Nitratireductor sp.]
MRSIRLSCRSSPRNWRAEEREAARRFAEEVLAVLLVVLIAISAIAMIFMPVLVEAVIMQFDPASEKFSMTVVMAQVMFPYLTAASLVPRCFRNPQLVPAVFSGSFGAGLAERGADWRSADRPPVRLFPES